MARFNGFGGGGGMNIQQMQKQAMKLQEQLREAQEELENTEFETTVAGGLVTVRMTGKKKVTAVVIDPKAVDPDDIEMLEDMIVAALNEAYEAAEAEYEEKMGAFGGMF